MAESKSDEYADKINDLSEFFFLCSLIDGIGKSPAFETWALIPTIRSGFPSALFVFVFEKYLSGPRCGPGDHRGAARASTIRRK